MEKRHFLERAPVGPGVKSWILNFIYHPQLSRFHNSESTIMSVMGRIQLENGKTGWESSGMADVASALFLCRMLSNRSSQKNGLAACRALRLHADG
jgi:hypothetical protein